MPYNIRFVSTYNPPRECGIGAFTRNLATAMADFTRDVESVAVAAIDKNKEEYFFPVDVIIEQNNPNSWRRAASIILSKAEERKNPTVVVLQHEFGLDGDGKSNNYVEIARRFRENSLSTFVYLHTIRSKPNDYQKETLLELSKNSNGLIVTTKSVIDMLETVYGISHSGVRHIDHGIRTRDPSEDDRLEKKRELGLEKMMLATTIGLRSPDKGIQFAIPAYAKFLNESCTEDQRKCSVYLIAGECHPEFVRADQGRQYHDYINMIHKALEESNLKWAEIKEIDSLKNAARENDVVILDTFLSEKLLMDLYAATNMMILPYLNLEQTSSGILADTLGSGRAAISTKFQYALELLYPEKPEKGEGVIIEPHYGRGILVDSGKESIEQIALAIHYLVFRERERLAVEERARTRGYEMRWDNTAWQLIQLIRFIENRKERETGRGPKFELEKDSPLEAMLKQLKVE